MEYTRQQLGDGDWPERWCVYLRAYNERGDARVEKGGGVTVDKNGTLTYRCVCGDTFNRHQGERIQAARQWIALHRTHGEHKAQSLGGE